ncbi:conserved hypothetical protein [Desulforamulus reducens MI-1]|uniref:DUF2905 domain-containing protein n=1 Tax=Desulforamulus reducens (strain ATCC BAA-1160 / DSM 100696 / MI-1) TaxID=349161 RepID=A4J539_DESRM|nr:DUF2905 domain-containing protein [Desulforamulus reducens]ABO50192.1 conserved hypothetical protein [Desulforamulus reducens MI-1]
MTPFESIAKMLIFAGISIAILGGMLLIVGKIPGIGKLPGDIFVRKGNFTFYFPVVTSILLSILLTFIINLFFRR